jgi:galactarate dehydratase
MFRIIKIHPQDNVAIPVQDIPRGTGIGEGLLTLEDIPQGHKIALGDLKRGDALIRYGVSLGCLNRDIAAGALVGEDMLDLPRAASPDAMPSGTVLEENPLGLSGSAREELRAARFEGYETPGNGFAGTRNILGIMTTVQCVSGVLNAAVRKIKAELLPKYPQVDDVIPLNHDYGCGVAIHARGSEIPQRTLKNLLRNPNFGGEIMVVALGCEKLTADMLLEERENNDKNLIVLQNLEGFHGMIDAIMKMADRKLRKLNERRRRPLPLERLCIGMQCGGSDAFSGITANPAAGYASDLLIAAGGTVLFSEVTEVRDGVEKLAARCAGPEVAI